MSHPTLMVIDLDPVTTDLVREALDPGACVVLAFESTEEGVAAAAEWPPDAIVLCADMSGGFRACRRLKKDAATRDIPLVLVSAHATDAQLEEHQRLPTRADVYLRKPLEAANLSFVLTELLSRGGAIEELDVEEIELPELTPPKELLPEEPLPEAPADLDFSEAPVTDPERDAPSDRLAELTRAYTELLQDHSALTSRLQSTTDALALQGDENEALARQVASLTASLEQAESSHAATQARFAALGAELERERAARLQAEAAQGEARRLAALNADLSESLEAIGESLRSSIEIVDRYRELSGVKPAEREPRAMGAGDALESFVALDDL